MDFKVIEEKWQKVWTTSTEALAAKDGLAKPKKYVLVEFPYPSGSGLHIGHTFSFTGGDVYARFKRMQGYNVLFPIGWDAFGLPTENYAIKMKKKPQEVTKENTTMFRNQMKKLAFSFDWSREINTTDPKYYKWTQWIFIKMWEKGLVHKKEMPINWCPSCKIGLANEEVVDGKCERCGTETEKRNISQWVVKITEYADRLIDGLKDTDFIEKVKTAQINWIGKSEGAHIKFEIKNNNSGDAINRVSTIDTLEVFTTRPDTLYGATFMVIAPEHPLVGEIVNKEEIKEYVNNARKKSEMERTELSKEKTGVFSGLYAINPVNGKEIPIWISDFVLASYGTGAIMSVPAHDDRDNEFAKKYNLPIIPVYNDKDVSINSEILNGLSIEEAKEKITKWLVEKGVGEKTSSYHLRDWIFSRQHYWGEPIPMINCPKCGYVPVSESQLPVTLPEVEHYEPTDDGRSPLVKMTDWVNTTCPKCGGMAKRETDVMPNWAGSDWYFLRYLDPDNDIELCSQEKLNYWCPVDVYIGGDEHNTLHLLYSRFVYQFLWDIGAVPKDKPEPYFKRLSHGVILGPNNQRMSKSRGNVIVPEVIADKYGVDVVRMYLMFIGPFDATMAWNEKTLMGVKRFLDRLEKYVLNVKIVDNDNEEVLFEVNKTIRGVGDDLENFRFNTGIAKQMELLNKLQTGALSQESRRALIQMISVYAPYMAEELWKEIGENGSVHTSIWPKWEEKYLIQDKVKIAVAVNGKVRDILVVPMSEVESKETILDRAKSLEKIETWIAGKNISREVYVSGKMVNIVLG